ncbi:hypothetical protein [Nocardia altamirensis]|uniref:hypothetical protein n=1 Tax=Nocardia altamirensis TaxID=472158 RepID=UPI0008405AF3|nr:hypothetical protein [Nocardia altamirensis]
MGTYKNTMLVLGVLAAVAIGLLAANWSSTRAVVYAVVWSFAALFLIARDFYATRRHPKPTDTPAPEQHP